MIVKTREEYANLRARGIDALCDIRYEVEIGLRRELQRERFGTNTQEADQKFYKFILSHRTMVCEHCGKPIRYPSAINVSHILTRGSHPEMAFDSKNVNILCADCHMQFEHSTTRRKMNPWFLEKIERRIEQLKKEYNGTK